MKNTTFMFQTNLAYENNLDTNTAEKIVEWLENEGVLDYEIIDEVYGETPVAVNDAA